MPLRSLTRLPHATVALATVLLVAGCGSTPQRIDAPAATSGGGTASSSVRPSSPRTVSTPAPDLREPSAPPAPMPAPPSPAPVAAQPPLWLGTRVLDGTGAGEPTPPELDPRAFTLPSALPPPVNGQFASTISPVPADVVARSSWHQGCPVTLDELRYVTVSFWGFDDRPHTGELLVNREIAAPVVAAFGEMYTAHFPIEQMRVTAAAEIDAPPTGDGNNTGSFVCRASVGSGSWSQHAYGLAVDVNPFQNPYSKGTTVIPELATSYLQRDRVRPGMITGDGVVVQAFGHNGLTWGGRWRSSKDYMHFSKNGR